MKVFIGIIFVVLLFVSLAAAGGRDIAVISPLSNEEIREIERKLGAEGHRVRVLEGHKGAKSDTPGETYVVVTDKDGRNIGVVLKDGRIESIHKMNK